MTHDIEHDSEQYTLLYCIALDIKQFVKQYFEALWLLSQIVFGESPGVNHYCDR